MELVAVRQLGRRLDPLPSMKVPLVEPWSTTYQPPTASTPSMSSTDGELQDGEVTVDLCEVVDRPQGVGDMLPGRGSRGPEVSECRSVKAFTG
jgi:hypothetical protein